MPVPMLNSGERKESINFWPVKIKQFLASSAMADSFDKKAFVVPDVESYDPDAGPPQVGCLLVD